MNPIVKKNLRLMMFRSARGMIYEASVESFGNKWEGLNCCWVNFLYNKDTGEIFIFGNDQNIPGAIKRNLSTVKGTFIVDLHYKIRQILYFKGDTEQARVNLSLSAGLYNELREKKKR